MKKFLLYFLLIGAITFTNANHPILFKTNNTASFSFEISPQTTSGTISIKTNLPNKNVILVKIIDKAGYIRIQKKLHLEREIDVSALKKGHYLVKVYHRNSMAINRFYKGKDAINNR
ncbi:T9SS type A sorting domain-containing protein [Aquimarina sp. D1M17]|uniref:T9SS type A sorting domain-containing protein n=1 Tax=Aquimarina acroporae TaxID=2937283 RepID=UPI0020C02C42|nr:T9SS type A sorting domain-containing protein [Aquimarina acroporae]MCK8520794.1 T9SS type A sorting domain-containing protein [Aquimarina acroporae]